MVGQRHGLDFWHGGVLGSDVIVMHALAAADFSVTLFALHSTTHFVDGLPLKLVFSITKVFFMITVMLVLVVFVVVNFRLGVAQIEMVKHLALQLHQLAHAQLVGIGEGRCQGESTAEFSQSGRHLLRYSSDIISK